MISNIKSDLLVHLRPLLESVGIFKDMAQIEQFEIILDANIILRDIIWICKKRKNPLAKTEMQELLHSQTLIPQAPTFLKEEVALKIPEIAKKKSISESHMQEEWERYAQYISFYDITVEEYEKENKRDPKDLPYIKLQEATGTLIYSKDKDISAMGGQTINCSVIASLREYSRDAAVEYTLKMSGIATIHISEALITMIWELISGVFSEIKKLPKWVQWIGIGIVIFALIHRDSRTKLLLFINLCFANLSGLLGDIIKELEPMYNEHERVKEKTSKNLEVIQKEFSKI